MVVMLQRSNACNIFQDRLLDFKRSEIAEMTWLQCIVSDTEAAGVEV